MNLQLDVFLSKLSCYVFGLSLILLHSGCAKSLDDFYDEGQTIILSLIQDLEVIQTRQDLLYAYPKLQKYFLELVHTIISAESLLDKNSQHSISPLKESVLSDRLREELNRIYQIEGAKEIIEKCQKEALYRLDAFEKRRLNRKNPS